MTETCTIKEGTPPTEEQLKEVEEAAKRPIVLDEDYPELSPALMKSMRAAVAQRNRLLNRRKLNVNCSLRMISQAAFFRRKLISVNWKFS